MASIYKRAGKRMRGAPYYVAYNDEKGRRRTVSTKSTDRAVAERIAAKLESDCALRREGVIDASADGLLVAAKRPVDEHLREFEQKLLAAGNTEKHTRETVGYVRSIFQTRSILTISEITAPQLEAFARKLREENRSNRTIQAYLTAAKGFTRWLVEQGRLRSDPLVGLRKPNPQADRRHERRVLQREEWCLLRAAADSGPTFLGMSGVERRLLYETAIQTGYRANELRSLPAGALQQSGGRWFLVCRARSTKNRDGASQPITNELASELFEYLSIKKVAPHSPIFCLPDRSRMAQLIRTDLKAARTAWLAEVADDPVELERRQASEFLAKQNHARETLDFHSLRHTAGAWLALAGEHPKVIQAFMRHSTITLTMDTYGHLFPGQEARAAETLGRMVSESSQRSLGPNNPKTVQRQRQRAGRETVRRGANGCDQPPEGVLTGETPNALSGRALCDVVQDRATSSERRARDSNPQPVSRQLISNQSASHSLTLLRNLLYLYPPPSFPASGQGPSWQGSRADSFPVVPVPTHAPAIGHVLATWETFVLPAHDCRIYLQRGRFPGTAFG